MIAENNFLNTDQRIEKQDQSEIRWRKKSDESYEDRAIAVYS